MKFILLACLLCLSLACGQSKSNSSTGEPHTQIAKAPSVVANGNETGNGADYFGTDKLGAAWILGRGQKISYCIVPGGGFGYSQEQLRTMIESGFSKWSDYMHLKRINENRDSRLTIVTDTVFSADCTEQVDLRFYFGVSDPLSKKYENSFKNPLAFVARTNPYDPIAGRGRGLVWIAPSQSLNRDAYLGDVMRVPNWTLSYSLSGVILHELGHIFGIAHVDGTIMEEKISNFLISQDEALRFNRLTSIDGYRDLAICTECTLDYFGRLGSPPESTRTSTPKGELLHDAEVEVFSLLQGRQPQGKVSAKVTSDLRGFVLHVADDGVQNGGDDFPITLNKSEFKPGLRKDDVFKIWRFLSNADGSLTEADGGEFYDRSYVESGVMPSHSGLLHVHVSRNMQGETIFSPLIIDYDRDGMTRVLFINDYNDKGEFQ